MAEWQGEVLLVLEESGPLPHGRSPALPLSLQHLHPLGRALNADLCASRNARHLGTLLMLEVDSMQLLEL